MIRAATMSVTQTRRNFRRFIYPLSVRLSVRHSPYPSVCLAVCLSFCLSVHHFPRLSVCVSVIPVSLCLYLLYFPCLSVIFPVFPSFFLSFRHFSCLPVGLSVRPPGKNSQKITILGLLVVACRHCKILLKKATPVLELWQICTRV